MIFASELRDRAVVDIDSAEKIGYVHDVLLDAEGGRVAGLVVSVGMTLLGGKYTNIPISAVHGVGHDAITARRDETIDLQGLDALSRLSHLVGRKVVTQSGEFLGSVKDALLDGVARTIIGYPLNRPGGLGSLTSMFGIGGRARADYLRTDARLRFGPDLIVAPDDVVVRDAEAPEVVAPPSQENGDIVAGERHAST